MAFKGQAQKAKEIFSEREQNISDILVGAYLVFACIDYIVVVAVDIYVHMKSGDTILLQGKSSFCFQGNEISRILNERKGLF
ncbi:hypothetical protein WJR50_30625 [Catalinimonas sp. 4WD22]|uniref:hypothetical protein n=1 Tax=Catalinimonas locisalis TaxID=3133978 RepID=UPI0031013121